MAQLGDECKDIEIPKIQDSSRSLDLDARLAGKEKLTAVLTYHVLPRKVMAVDIVKLDSVNTVRGEPILRKRPYFGGVGVFEI